VAGGQTQQQQTQQQTHHSLVMPSHAAGLPAHIVSTHGKPGHSDHHHFHRHRLADDTATAETVMKPVPPSKQKFTSKGVTVTARADLETLW
jgi:hypothetical protein